MRIRRQIGRDRIALTVTPGYRDPTATLRDACTFMLQLLGTESLEVMDPVFLRDFARRCHALMLSARTDAARRQLAMWVEEFERQAQALEHGLAGQVQDEPKTSG
jgi:hypothetical protein